TQLPAEPKRWTRHRDACSARRVISRIDAGFRTEPDHDPDDRLSASNNATASRTQPGRPSNCLAECSQSQSTSTDPTRTRCSSATVTPTIIHPGDLADTPQSQHAGRPTDCSLLAHAA